MQHWLKDTAWRARVYSFSIFFNAITWQGLCMMISVSISMEFWHRMALAALAPFVCEPFQSVPFEPFQSVPFLKGTCSFACRVSFLFEQCPRAKQNWSAVIHHGYDGPCWFTWQGWKGLLETGRGHMPDPQKKYPGKVLGLGRLHEVSWGYCSPTSCHVVTPTRKYIL